jgi:predicted permease
LSNENTFGAAVTIPGYVSQPGEDTRIDMKQVYPGYFAALGIPILAGRDLTEADDLRESATVAVINEKMARRFFGSPGDAIGRTFKDRAHEARIVGVAGNTRDRALRDDSPPMAYETFMKAPTGRGQMTLLVRAAGDPRALASTIRQLARETDPTMPLLDVQTVGDRVDAASRQEQLVALLSSLFGAIALALAAIGLYGVLSYGVARRQPEFGVRLALGASPRGLVQLVLGESCMLVGAGLLAGLAAAAAAAGAISRMLFGLDPLDPISYAAASAALLAVGLLAAWIPAQHASRIEPSVILRMD